MAHDHVRPWVREEVMALPEDGHRYELIDGGLIVNPPTGPRHQSASYILHKQLELAALDADAAVVIYEGVGISMPDGNLLIPDLLIARAGAPSLDKPLIDPADVLLVAEIVSPGSRRRDRAVKPYMYAESGIRHYWRIETDRFTDLTQSLPVVVMHELAGAGEYVVRRTVGAGEVLAVDEPFPIKFDPAELVRC
ncbi:MAG TPA: Uma2 family endonuclease [Actinokineospora sp.]|jgi:Uma2 family endonuclease|nr:Uma2 family endonuclease [Actinokineospora sp.]